MERINKDRILKIWSLIVFRKGKSKYGKPIPNLILINRPNQTRTIGEYIYEDNSIKIWFQDHCDFRELTSTILHEYTHYLQFWPWYSRYQKMYSYKDNPYEIQANLSESEAPFFIKEISQEKWKSNIKNQRLKKIYGSSNRRIGFES